MDTVLFHGSQDQRFSPYTNPSFISTPHLDMLHKMGLLQPPPPPPFHSYPSFPLQQQLPPLLPLPSPDPRHAALARGHSCPTVNKRANYTDRKTRNSLTPKKSKPHNKNANKNSPKLITAPSTTPARNELAKDVKKALPAMRRSIPPTDGARSTSLNVNALKAEGDHFGMFLGPGVFTISPPPSSLPLPSFSLRSKLSCNSQAAVVDTSATDSLRRYLQLR